MIGKTYWKSVVLPSVLMGTSVVCWNKGEIEKLQRIENGVWRVILGAPSYTANVTLQGEIGASSMEARDMKIKLSYESYLSGCCNELVRSVYEETRGRGDGRWADTTGNYRMRLGVDLRELRSASYGAG